MVALIASTPRSVILLMSGWLGVLVLVGGCPFPFPPPTDDQPPIDPTVAIELPPSDVNNLFAAPTAPLPVRATITDEAGRALVARVVLLDLETEERRVVPVAAGAVVGERAALLDLSSVPPAGYALTVETLDERGVVVGSATAATRLTVSPPPTELLNEATPVATFEQDRLQLLCDPNLARQVFGLGVLVQGDRLTMRVLGSPDYDRRTDNGDQRFGVLVLNARGEIFAWVRDPFAFSELAELIIADSAEYFVVVEGGVSLDVHVARGANDRPAQRRVVLDFDGATQVLVAGIVIDVPVFDAADFNQYFAVSPEWGPLETEEFKQRITNFVRAAYAPYNVVITTTDEPLPDAPFMRVFVGGILSPLLLGKADIVDPRDPSRSPRAIIWPEAVAAFTVENAAQSRPVNDLASLAEVIGCVTVHEIGHLFGLQHTDDPQDTMCAVCDITAPLTFTSAPITRSFADLPPIGVQNARFLLRATLGDHPRTAGAALPLPDTAARTAGPRASRTPLPASKRYCACGAPHASVCGNADALRELLAPFRPREGDVEHADGQTDDQSGRGVAGGAARRAAARQP